MANKPSIPKGTRDFGPEEMAKRNYIFDTIKAAFQLYGFRQIETPAMETLHTLMGKYGEEGDKLLFKVLNSGDYLKKVSDEELADRNVYKLQTKLCEKGLRYDLTVPFARYVVMHREELQMPFKRYQISPYGGPTVRRRDATGSSTSATPTSWAATRSSTRWSWCRLWTRSSRASVCVWPSRSTTARSSPALPR